MVAKSSVPKILVVDDDVRLRDLLTRYLTEQGFQVAALTDASQLDKKLQRDPPHLVVLDLMLPGEDGLAVCRRLRGAGETVPIIMLTAKGEDVDRIHASSSRAFTPCCAGMATVRQWAPRPRTVASRSVNTCWISRRARSNVAVK